MKLYQVRSSRESFMLLRDDSGAKRSVAFADVHGRTLEKLCAKYPYTRGEPVAVSS